VKLEHHALLAFVIDQVIPMKENAAVVLEVGARNGLAPGIIGIERRGPQNDVLAGFEGAVALTDGHGSPAASRTIRW
jgi:hypothetical protein